MEKKQMMFQFTKMVISDHLKIMYHFSYSQFVHCTKMKFSIKDFFSKCDQICRKLRIWSHLLKNFLMENFIFCAVVATYFIVSFLMTNLNHSKKTILFLQINQISSREIRVFNNLYL